MRRTRSLLTLGITGIALSSVALVPTTSQAASWGNITYRAASEADTPGSGGGSWYFEAGYVEPSQYSTYALNVTAPKKCSRVEIRIVGHNSDATDATTMYWKLSTRGLYKNRTLTQATGTDLETVTLSAKVKPGTKMRLTKRTVYGSDSDNYRVSIWGKCA